VTQVDYHIERPIDESLHATDDATTRSLFTLSSLQASHYVTKATESANQVDRSPTKPKDFSTLVYFLFQIDGCPDVIKDLCNSEAELLVLYRGIVPDEKLHCVGLVKLRGFFGGLVDAVLAVGLIKLGLADNYLQSKYLTIHCAVCEDMNYSLIFTAYIVRRLKMRHGHPVAVTGSCINTAAISDTPLTDQPNYTQDDRFRKRSRWTIDVKNRELAFGS
jgi:hypothetical protein